MTKLKTTLGVTAGIFNETGRKILLRRRKEHDSITSLDYFGCWELPIVAVQEATEKTIPYDYLCRELIRGVKAETGFVISLIPMPAFFTLPFKNDKGEYDLLLITTLSFREVIRQEETQNELRFVDVDELNELALEYSPAKKGEKGELLQEGKGLLSGFGKRQHLAALKVMERLCPSEDQGIARKTLFRIQADWK